MRWLVIVSTITLLVMCGKAEKQPQMYLLHPRASSTTEYAEPQPAARKPYDFRYPIHPPSGDNLRNYYRDPERPAVRISGNEPMIPEIARKAHVSGIVILQLAIDAKGRPTHYLVLKPLPFGLDHAAVEAVRTWRFKPAMDRGRPVPVIQDVTVIFRPQS